MLVIVGIHRIPCSESPLEQNTGQSLSRGIRAKRRKGAFCVIRVLVACEGENLRCVFCNNKVGRVAQDSLQHLEYSSERKQSVPSRCFFCKLYQFFPLALFVPVACSASALRLRVTLEWPFRSLGWFGAGGDCFCEASIKLIEGRTRRLLRDAVWWQGVWANFILYTLYFVLRASCEAGQKGMSVILFYWICRRLSFRSTLLQLSGLIGVKHRNMGNVLSQGGLLRGDPLRPV